MKHYHYVFAAGMVLLYYAFPKKFRWIALFVFSVDCAGTECGNDCSIQINGGEKAKKQRGLNLVIYNHELRSVVDSVCFDTYVSELTASR